MLHNLAMIFSYPITYDHCSEKCSLSLSSPHCHPPHAHMCIHHLPTYYHPLPTVLSENARTLKVWTLYRKSIGTSSQILTLDDMWCRSFLPTCPNNFFLESARKSSIESPTVLRVLLSCTVKFSDIINVRNILRIQFRLDGNCDGVSLLNSLLSLIWIFHQLHLFRKKTAVRIHLDPCQSIRERGLSWKTPGTSHYQG